MSSLTEVLKFSVMILDGDLYVCCNHKATVTSSNMVYEIMLERDWKERPDKDLKGVLCRVHGERKGVPHDTTLRSFLLHSIMELM
jgi:hypothetical protein